LAQVVKDKREEI